MKRLLVFLLLVPALCLAAGDACCQPPEAGHPPRMFFLRRSGPAAIFGYKQHLYVTACGKLLEYKLDGMTLERSVDLPACAPQRIQRTAKAEGRFRPMPPPPPPPTGLWAGDGKLYLLSGPAIYVYKAPGLTLEKTVMLPRPKLPQAEK